MKNCIQLLDCQYPLSRIRFQFTFLFSSFRYMSYHKTRSNWAQKGIPGLVADSRIPTKAMYVGCSIAPKSSNSIPATSAPASARHETRKKVSSIAVELGINDASTYNRYWHRIGDQYWNHDRIREIAALVPSQCRAAFEAGQSMDPCPE